MSSALGLQPDPSWAGCFTELKWFVTVLKNKLFFIALDVTMSLMGSSVD